MVERKTDNLDVKGSSPFVPKTNTYYFQCCSWFFGNVQI